MISPEEREARGRKAVRLADALIPHVAALGALSGPQAAEAVRLLPEPTRLVVADLAGVRPASPHTWAIVAAIVRTRLENPR